MPVYRASRGAEYIHTNGSIQDNVILTNNKNNGQLILQPQTQITTNKWDSFSGYLFGPEKIAIPVKNIENTRISDIYEVGTDTAIYFVDKNKQRTYAYIRVPVSEWKVGEYITVYYSHNMRDWEYQTNTLVEKDNEGNLFVSFPTSHLTYFALGTEIGDFVINNDETLTTTGDVILHSSISGAVDMRIGNTAAARDAATRQTYNAALSWILSSGDGEKNVYVSFRNAAGDVIDMFDSIILRTDPCAGNELDCLVKPWIVWWVTNTRETITFDRTYTSTPVVLTTPITDNNGNNYPIPRLRNVSTTGFEISICVDAGAATCSATPSAENIGYFIWDVDKAATYNWIDVGTVSTKTDWTTTNITHAPALSGAPRTWLSSQTNAQWNNIAAVAWARSNNTILTTIVWCVHQWGGNPCTAGKPNDTIGYVSIHTANVVYYLISIWKSKHI